MFYTCIEWIGTLSALFGSLIIATHKIKPKYGWILWILSNIFFIYLFGNTKQYGLLLMNTIGLSINLVGFYQWTHNSLNVNKFIVLILLNFSRIFALSGIFLISYYLYFNIQQGLEWAGAAFGLAGAFLLSSRDKNAQLCWVYWFISNCLLIILTFFYTNQYGILTQQIAFNITNIIGIIRWFKNKKLITPTTNPHQSI